MVLVMMRIKLFILVIFFIISRFAFSANCGPSIDLNNSQPLISIPILDQDGAGLCYSFVASQMIEFEAKRKGYPVSPSQIDLAMKAGEGFIFDRGQLQGGFVADVLNSAKSKGVARRSCVEAEIKRFVGDSKMTSSQFATLIDLINQTHKWKWSKSDEYESVMSELEKHKKSYPKQGKKAKKIGNEMDFLNDCEYDKVVKSLQAVDLLGETSTAVLKKIIGSCPVDKVPSLNYSEFERDTEKVDEDEDKKLEINTDNFLTKKKPVVLALCAKTFGALDYINYRYEKNSDDCGNHVVMAVGKRENKGKCEYLIRNSWGSSWAPPEVDCSFKLPDGRYFSSKKTWNEHYETSPNNDKIKLSLLYMRRVEVGCWYPVKQIMKNTKSVGGFE